MIKPYILFSPQGEYFYTTKKQAEVGKEIHSGFISQTKMYKEQILVRGNCL